MKKKINTSSFLSNCTLRALALLVAMLSVISSFAYTFEEDGIYYYTSGSLAIVTYSSTNFNSYSGDVIIPRTVTHNGKTYTVYQIEENAFRACTDLYSVQIPNTVRLIYPYAFAGSSKLKRVVLPDSLFQISKNAFSACSELEDIKLGNHLRSLGKHVFVGCKSITHIEIPHLIKIIPEGAFLGCDNLNRVVLPDSLKAINGIAFNSCKSLKSIEIPCGLSIIANGAFNGSGLKTLYWNAKNCKYDYQGTQNVEDTTLNAPFSISDSLSHIIIGDNVESIGDYIFYSPPASDYIDSHMNIKIVTCKALVPPTISSKCFADETYENAILCVPEEVISVYRTKPGWKKFRYCVAIDDVIIAGDVNDDDRINISDVTALIDFLLSDDDSHINRANSDVNGDGKINISDVTSLIEILLTQHE